MPAPVRVIWIALLGVVTGFILTRKRKVSHSVEIRHDRMILDGQDVFWADRIGRQWPQLQNKGDDPNRMVIAGIYGNRWVEYMTANRVDENDRTPKCSPPICRRRSNSSGAAANWTFPDAFTPTEDPACA